MNTDSVPLTITGHWYDSLEDYHEARNGGEDRGYDATYPVSADNAERLIIQAEGLPDPDHILDDDEEDTDG